MLTVDQVKARLGIESDDDTYDEAMSGAVTLVQRWFEQYCNRGLGKRSVSSETIYNTDGASRIYLFARPIQSMTSVTLDGEQVSLSSLRVNKEGGWIEMADGSARIAATRVIVVSYVGGYDPDQDMPEDLAQAFAEAVGARVGYSGGSTSTGSGTGAIRSIGLGGGALSVQFDTSQQTGGYAGAYDVSNIPVEVQRYASVLDYYRVVPL